MRRLVLIGFSLLWAAGWTAAMYARRLWRTWGIDPVEAERTLPGDALIPDATMSDTRGITIDATPSEVWPWLLQLGYGRGGWYSYDRMDMRGRSADTILPEFQSLAVGDTVPTDPDGGFEVRLLEPERALALYVDQEIVGRRRATPGAATAGAAMPPGLQASGRFMQTSMPPEFAISWQFVLEPMSGGRTRLIERLRGRFAEGTPGTRVLMPLLGLGIFVMERRQMLGVAERAARHHASSAPASGAPGVDAPQGTTRTNGHAPESEAAGAPGS